MPSASTLDCRHPIGSFRSVAWCRMWSRSEVGGVAPCAGAMAVVPGARVAGQRTVQFAQWGQDP